MNDHELDLLLALAEGRLTGADREAAEALVAADPRLREELALQRRALEAATTLDRPTMTPAERVELHTALRRHLALDAPEPTPAARRAGPAWWRRLAPAFAVATILLAFVVVASRGGGGNESTVAVADEAATTAAPGGPLAEMGTAAPTTAAKTTVPSSPSDLAAAESADAAGAPDVFLVPVVDPDAVRRGRVELEGIARAAVATTEIPRSAVDACRPSIEDAVGVAASVVPLATDGEATSLEVTFPDGSSRLVAIVLADCSILSD